MPTHSVSISEDVPPLVQMFGNPLYTRGKTSSADSTIGFYAKIRAGGFRSKTFYFVCNTVTRECTYWKTKSQVGDLSHRCGALIIQQAYAKDPCSCAENRVRSYSTCSVSSTDSESSDIDSAQESASGGRSSFYKSSRSLKIDIIAVSDNRLKLDENNSCTLRLKGVDKNALGLMVDAFCTRVQSPVIIQHKRASRIPTLLSTVQA